MKKIFVQFLAISLISNTAYADVIWLEKGTAANFSGFLFDEKAGKDVKAKLVDLEYFQKLNESLQKQVTFLEAIEKRSEEKLTIVLDRNDQLAKSLNSARSLNDLERVLYFAAGVLGTILVLYGVKQVAK